MTAENDMESDKENAADKGRHTHTHRHTHIYYMWLNKKKKQFEYLTSLIIIFMHDYFDWLHKEIKHINVCIHKQMFGNISMQIYATRININYN